MSMRFTQPPGRRGTDSPRVVEQHSTDSVVIDGTVEIVLLRVHADRVQLGVVAPDGVPIARSEIHRDRSRDYLT